MIDLRPVCENCAKELPANSLEAMICSFECTFCSTCVEDILHNVCPNCGGGFSRRPIRPVDQLSKHPVSTVKIFSPINTKDFEVVSAKYRHVPPEER